MSYITSTFVVWLTYVLVKRPDLSPTRVSSAVSLLVFIILYTLSLFIDFDVYRYSILFFGASFVGMSSHKIISIEEVVFGGLLYTAFFSLLVGHFPGVGGILGFAAFVSVVLSKSILKIFKKIV